MNALIILEGQNFIEFDVNIAQLQYILRLEMLHLLHLIILGILGVQFHCYTTIISGKILA